MGVVLPPCTCRQREMAARRRRDHAGLIAAISGMGIGKGCPAMTRKSRPCGMKPRSLSAKPISRWLEPSYSERRTSTGWRASPSSTRAKTRSLAAAGSLEESARVAALTLHYRDAADDLGKAVQLAVPFDRHETWRLMTARAAMLRSQGEELATTPPSPRQSTFTGRRCSWCRAARTRRIGRPPRTG